MNKMFAFIEPEIPNSENGKLTICYDTVHVSICAKYNGGNVRDQCVLCFRVVKAISDARDTHLSAVMGSETNCLLNALITDTDFPFVTNNESTIATLEGIFKQWRKGSGTSRNDEQAIKEAECNRKKQLEEEEELHPPEYNEHVTCQAKTNRQHVTNTNRHRTFEEQVESLAAYKAEHGDCHVKPEYNEDVTRQAKTNRQHVTGQAKTNQHRTFEEQVECLAAYKDIYGDCHVPQTYKDDTELANWVSSVRRGFTILSVMQKQILDAMGFAWDIDEINESKRQQMVFVANESEYIQETAKLWTSVPEEGKTTIRQTPEFRLAVKTCLTKGHTQLVIALAIHDSSIAKGHYSGECRGKGLNYEKIYKSVYDCNRALENQK